MTASVYVMDDGLHRKVGFSEDPYARAVQVRRDSEVKIAFLHETDDCHRIERAAHLLLGPHNVGGEWFDVSVDAAIAAVKQAISRPYAPTDVRGGDRHASVAKTIRFDAEQEALLEAIKAKVGGTYADAISAAARALLGQHELTAEDIVAWVRSRA